MTKRTSPVRGVVAPARDIVRRSDGSRPGVFAALAAFQTAAAFFLLLVSWPTIAATANATAMLSTSDSSAHIVSFAAVTVLGTILFFFSPAHVVMYRGLSRTRRRTKTRRGADTLGTESAMGRAAISSPQTLHRDRRGYSSSAHSRSSRPTITSASSGPSVAHMLAIAIGEFAGASPDSPGYELEVDRGRMRCDDAILRQSIVHLLTAAASDCDHGRPWEIAVRNRSGDPIASLRGAVTEQHRAFAMARGSDAVFATALAEALLKSQNATLETAIGRDGRWRATLVLAG